MATAKSIFKMALNIKLTNIIGFDPKVEAYQAFGETHERTAVHIRVKPFKKAGQRCPHCIAEGLEDCGKKKPRYDRKKDENHPTIWRASDWNGIRMYLEYSPVRISCPIHGVTTEYIPWADGRSHYTEDFNNEVAYLALLCPKTVICQFFGINWRTVGNCIKAAHDRIEPDITARLQGLRRICVDETSYSRGHKYITVVYDMDRNQVVWLHEGHGLKVFREFCKLLTEEEQLAMEFVAGDGARWITSCTTHYFKNAIRCIDPFHVTEWVNGALDVTRSKARSDAAAQAAELEKEFVGADTKLSKQAEVVNNELTRAREELDAMPKKGRPSRRKKELILYIAELEKQLEDLTHPEVPIVTEEEYKAACEELAAMPKKGRPSKRKDYLLSIVSIYETGTAASKSKLSLAHQKILDDMEQQARSIKNAKYALGKNPENLTEAQQDKLKLIESTCPDLFRAYQLKERIRTILHMRDVSLAEIELDKWNVSAATCGIPAFEKLSEKIRRHRGHILNTVRYHLNSAQSEATNCSIKAMIATSRGFRNLDNMFALVYLHCSDLVIPLRNRYQPTPEVQKKLRDIQNQQRWYREEMRKQAV